MNKRLITFLPILALSLAACSSSSDTAASEVTAAASNSSTTADRKFQAEGCHAKVSAFLQMKDGGTWTDVIAAQGWEAVASCPTTNPYAPWAMANIQIGTTIRWHIYSPGDWDFYTTESEVQVVFDPNSFAPIAAQAEIKSADYPYVAALARASILSEHPVAPTTQKITYQFESDVPIENQNMIQEGANNFLSHFGNILSYSSKPINFIVYSTNAGASDLAKDFDPSDSYFLEDLASAVKAQGNRERNSTDGMGGFSMGYKRVVVIGASYFKSSDLNLPTFEADPVVATHELAHELQASITRGPGMRNPVWLCEGGAQVIGAAMSVYQGKDYWAIGGRDQWSNRIPANLTIADLKTMEGEDPKLREYTAGGALSEYLIAWGGFDNSLLVTQLSYQFQMPDEMLAFRLAFEIIYGQSLDDFYVHALPYVNYASTNWKTSLATSPEATAFINDRLGAIKAAETGAGATKIAAE